METRFRVTLEEGLARLGASGEPRFVELLRHGSLVVELYAPIGQDLQTPHTRDEVYVIARGSGTFRNGEATHPFGPGDVLFVPAGVIHRFEEFTDDFSTWVFFYGPRVAKRPTYSVHPIYARRACSRRPARRSCVAGNGASEGGCTSRSATATRPAGVTRS